MSFIKKLLGKQEKPIQSYTDFWEWFLQNEKKFYTSVKQNRNINTAFFDKLAPKLNELKDGIWFLTGMYDETTAELILTADGALKNIIFVEELVSFAPQIEHWKITALKQPNDKNLFGINMDGYVFDENTMSFYWIEHSSMPDEIDIIIAHSDLTEENRVSITNGIYLALDNNLGELNTVTMIDNLSIIHPSQAEKELISLNKLKDFLIWREKEFVEKYKGFRHNIENDNYSSLEATLDNGLPLLAIVNSDLLNWDCKASHPWVVIIEIKYDGQNNNGMPGDETYILLNEIEDKITLELKDTDGYLNIGRQTANNIREIYLTCYDFRKPSKILYELKEQYQRTIHIDFDIFKDKYWQSLNRFQQGT